MNILNIFRLHDNAIINFNQTKKILIIINFKKNIKIHN